MSAPNGQSNFNQENPSKTKVIHSQVNEVTAILSDNIDKVIQRGENLNTLQDRTENLQASSAQFRRGANEVRKKMWWKNMKMNLIIGGLLLLVILVVVISVVATKGSNNSKLGSNPAPNS